MNIPKNLDAERAVLQACFATDKALTRIVSMLEPSDFYSEINRVLFSAIKAAAREGRNVQLPTVYRFLPSEEYKTSLADLAMGHPTGANAHLYAKDVLEAAKARRVMDIADRLKTACSSGSPDEYEGAHLRAIGELESLVRSDRANDAAKPIGDCLEDLAAWLDEATENGGVTGIRSGIPALDNVTKGLKAGRMYVLAGRPGSGKSLLAAQIGLSAARNQGKRVLLCSTEMEASQYMARLACAIAGVDPERFESGKAQKADKERVLFAGAEIRGLPYMIADGGSQSVDDVRAAVMRYEPDLLIVDYLQRLMPINRNASRYEQVSQVSFDLDRIKNDFSIPVIAAAQLNRAVDSRNDKRPLMSDLRDSGTIEQDADYIGMLYRPSQYDDDADPDVIHFELEKNRHGRLRGANLHTGPGMWISDQRPGTENRPVNYA